MFPESLTPLSPDLLPEFAGCLPVALGLAEVLLVVTAVDVKPCLVAEESVLSLDPLSVLLFVDPAVGSNNVAVHRPQDIVITPLGIFPPRQRAAGVPACPCAAITLMDPFSPALVAGAVVHLSDQLGPGSLDFRGFQVPLLPRAFTLVFNDHRVLVFPDLPPVFHDLDGWSYFSEEDVLEHVGREGADVRRGGGHDGTAVSSDAFL